MVSNFEVELNCPACFDDLMAALRELETVTEVHASLAGGCVAVVHDGDERRLAELITDTAHRLVVADNAEIVQGRLHPVPLGSCHAHR